MRAHPSLMLALLACAPLPAAAGQQALDPSRMHPVTVPIRDGGTFDWNTKTWIRPGQQPLRTGGRPRTTVYRNTCTWVGGGFYYATEPCETLVDSGRIPSTSTPPSSLEGNPQGLVGVMDDQIIDNFQISYCTGAPLGQVAIQIGFYDNLRGHCAGNVPVTGKPLGLTLPEQASTWGDRSAYFDFGPASDRSLPGSSINGAMACWTIDVTFDRNSGFCLKSEGDGKWDNTPGTEEFSWTFEHDVPESIQPGTGPLIAGEPRTGGYGSGSYNVPFGTNSFGNECGTGFGTSNGDGWWLNIDGSMPGVAATTQGCSQAASAGTGCYWFGGWPAGPLGSFWMVLDAAGSCSGCSNRVASYCTPGTSAGGCQPLISSYGASSASAPSGFFLQVSALPADVDGAFFFGTSGRRAEPWDGNHSYLCARPPLSRTPWIAAPGERGRDCAASCQLDLNSFWSSRPSRNPGPGSVVQAQFWYRQTSGAGDRGTGLSSALEWTVCP